MAQATPALLTNNNIYKTLDFFGNTKSYTDLIGTVVSIGGTDYTVGTTWVPNFSNAKEALDPYELAASLVEVINGNPSNSLSAGSILPANSYVESYTVGTKVILILRGSSQPSVSTTIPGVSFATPVNSGGGSASAISTVFKTMTVNATPATGPDYPTAKSFEVENLETTNKLGVSKNIGDTFTLNPSMGTTFVGNPINYFFNAITGTCSIQFKINI